MKAIIILSLIAIAYAVPVDEKKPKVPSTPLVNNQNTPSKSASGAVVAPAAPSKPKRDTHQQTPIQPAVTAQKNVDGQSVNSPKATQVTDTSKNVRPNRDSQKATPTTAPAKKTETTPVASAPVPTQNSRWTRDVAQKAPTVDVSKQSQPDQTHNVQKNAAGQPTKAPVVSTFSRNRRDAPKPAEQSKIVPSGTSNVKVDSTPVVKASNTPAAPTSAVIKPKRDTTSPQVTSSNNQPSIRRPTPIDQVLKQKTAPATEAPKASDAKPIVKS